MDTPLRTVVKAISWQLLGLIVITLISYSHTGSIRSAISLASTSAILGTISYIIHERLWQRIRWGKTTHKA